MQGVSNTPVDGAGEGLGSTPRLGADGLGITWGRWFDSARKHPQSRGRGLSPLWRKTFFPPGYGSVVPAPFRITTICLGNICRSPMAEVILRERISATSLADLVIVDSAGTGDWHIGHPADPRASATLDAHRYNRGEHRARQIDETWIDEINLALVMDSSNYRDVEAIMRRAQASTELRMLRSFDTSLAHLDAPHPELDVPDPYYGGDDGFVDVLRMIERASDGVIDYVASIIDRDTQTR